MSLDQNLFTLIVTPSTEDPNVIDLIEPNGTIHYRKQRVPGDGSTYNAQLYDYMTQVLLADVKAPASTSKVKIIELHNPTSTVELKFTGTLTFKWGFQWETHEFEWKREECYLIRKPDPPVLVAITKEPPAKLKTSSLQILDYNLNRFDIDDRKGLEIVLLISLLTFSDANEGYHTPTPPSKSSASTTPVVTLDPPPLPSKPEPKSGVDRIAEQQALREEINDVLVEADGEVDDYAAYVDNLLRDDAMLIVTVRSETAEMVPKVLSVVEESKRLRHKADIEEPLHQYVLYDTIKPKSKRIKLDDVQDGKGKKYVPPNSLIVHLSKIPMPELEPKPAASSSSSGVSGSGALNSYPGEKKVKPLPNNPPREPSPSPKAGSSEVPRLKKPAKSAGPSNTSSPGNNNRSSWALFSRRSSSPNAKPAHIHSHEVHPTQPSPSPFQLANPGLYAAPPPPPPPIPPFKWQQQQDQQNNRSSGFFGSLRR